MVYKCKKCSFECDYQETFHQHEDECNKDGLLKYRELYKYYRNEKSFIATGARASVHHPKHYGSDSYCYKCDHPIECITIARNFNFNLGNVIKYIWRAGKKNKDEPVEDLEKALWYLFDEINHQSPGTAFNWAKKKLEDAGYKIEINE